MNTPITEFDEFAAVQALAGDTAAFGKLVTAYERRVFAFLGRMGFEQATAADLAQDIFVRAWRHRASFDSSQGAVIAWLFGIARNVALTEWRRAGRRPTACADEDALDTLAAPGDASQALERAEQRNHLHRALQQLSDADRTAIALSYIDGLSAPEAAALLHCRADAYRARLSRARRRLVVILGETL